MSEQDEPGLPELERQLDQAFATTRPRPGFEDDLWARLEARQPRPRRLSALGGPRWAALGSLAAVLVVGLLVVALARAGGGGGHTGGASPGAGSAAAPSRSGAGASVQRGGSLAPEVPPAQRVPRPAAADVLRVIAGSTPASTGSAVGPATAPSLPVYRYDPASGPAAGTILEQAAVPGGLTAVSYPARQAAEAESEASAQLAAAGERLVYVAVVSGGQGYLEPAYLFTGTAPVDGTTVPAQLLVPALAASAYR